MTTPSVALIFALSAVLAEGLRSSVQDQSMEKWHGQPYGQGQHWGGWRAPAAPCQYSQNTWAVAQCIYGLSHGGLYQVFPVLAGRDGVIDYNEWKSRVANSNPSLRIFITLASQEIPGKARAWGASDDANTIDWDDWQGFVQAASSASGAHMDASEWADYVSASVTAEALFDAANGHGGSFGFFKDEKLNTHEWANAFYKCGGGDGSVTLGELARSIGLTPADVHKVFKFIEAVGDKCDRGWRSRFTSAAADAATINQCEWNQLIPQMQRQSPGLSWGGVSKGLFANSIAQMVTKYYKTKPYTRYHR